MQLHVQFHSRYSQASSMPHGRAHNAQHTRVRLKLQPAFVAQAILKQIP